MKTVLEERCAEFRDFVWNHADDPFQVKFDQCASLTTAEARSLQSLLVHAAEPNATKLTKSILVAVKTDMTLVNRLLQLTGLTRNKIIQDIKGFIRQERIRVPLTSAKALFNSAKGAELASEYLARQVRRVFAVAKGKVDAAMLEVVNQATWPGYIRQERAKRSGHQAEFRVACLLKNCGLNYAPEEKAINPLCRDVVIDGMSYDLVCPAQERASLRIICTAHASNIGQYGESKNDLEFRKAVDSMKRAGDRDQTMLLAFIDGVGFESNRAGLNGVLTQADEFCQYRTIWKAAVLAAACEKRGVTVALEASSLFRFAPFLKKYGAKGVDLASLKSDRDGWIEAGDAFVKVR